MPSLLYVTACAMIITQYQGEITVNNTTAGQIHDHHHTSLTLVYQDVSAGSTLVN